MREIVKNIFNLTRGIPFSLLPLSYGHILSLHRIVPENTQNQTIYPSVDNLELTENELIEIIHFFKNKNYSFLSLDNLLHGLRTSSLPKKFVSLTFDDGYKDTYSIAYPILSKYNIPFTIFIASSYPNKKTIMWWYLLADLIESENPIDTDNKPIANATINEKVSSYNMLHKKILSLNYIELNHYLQTLFKDKNKIDLYKYSTNLVLDWEDIIQLSNDGNVTIGNHTVNHVNLKNYSIEEANLEILNSKTEIESHISKSVKYFSFPYGGVPHFSKEIIKDYHSSFIIKESNINSFQFKNSNHLPRFSINKTNYKKALKYMINGPILLNQIKLNLK